MERKNYDKFPEKGKKKKDEDDDDEDDENEDNNDTGYNYLLKMALYNLTEERVQKLLNEKEKKEVELQELIGTPIEHIWETDLETVLTLWQVLFFFFFFSFFFSF